MKRTTILSILLLIAFFTPWIDFQFITFSGFDLPKSIIFFQETSDPFFEVNSIVLLFVYVAYLIPLFSTLSILGDFLQFPFIKYIKKIDYFLALICSIIIIALMAKITSEPFSFLGFGLYLTFIISIIGIFIREKSIATKGTDNAAFASLEGSEKAAFDALEGLDNPAFDALAKKLGLTPTQLLLSPDLSGIILYNILGTEESSSEISDGQLTELKDLLDKQVITEDEFQQKKEEIIKKMG